MAFKMAGWSPFTRKTDPPETIPPIGQEGGYKPTKEELESFLIHPKDNKERITNYEESIKNEAEKAGMTVEEYKALKQRELEEYMGR